MLQGSPLLGAVFAVPDPGMQDLGALAILAAANVLLVAHVFLLNDICGLSVDLGDANKANGVFTARGVGRKEMHGFAAALLVASLLLFGSLGGIALGLSLAIAFSSALYSLPRFDWKGRALFGSLAHLVGGILHFLLGYSLGNVIDGRGLAFAVFFALIFAAGHLTQEVRDHQGDADNAVRTNAVMFGQRPTFAASLVLFFLAHVLLLVLAVGDILPRPVAALVVVFPVQLLWSLRTLGEGLTYTSVCCLQARYRALYAVVGLAMVVMLYGGSADDSEASAGSAASIGESG